jgi:hypothetical protein
VSCTAFPRDPITSMCAMDPVLVLVGRRGAATALVSTLGVGGHAAGAVAVPTVLAVSGVAAVPGSRAASCAAARGGVAVVGHSNGALAAVAVAGRATCVAWAAQPHARPVSAIAWAPGSDGLFAAIATDGRWTVHAVRGIGEVGGMAVRTGSIGWLMLVD